MVERVLVTTFGTLLSSPIPFLCITAIFELPLFAMRFVHLPSRSSIPMKLALVALFIVPSLIMRLLSEGPMCFAVSDRLRGRRVELRRCLQPGTRRFWTTCATSTVLALAITGGMSLLFFPGLYIWTVFAVAVPATVTEGTGVVAGLGRSWKLSRGHRRSIFLTLISIAGPLALLTYALRFALRGSRFFGPIGVGWELLAAVIHEVVPCVIYFQLRESEEGIDPIRAAAVFD